MAIYKCVVCETIYDEEKEGVKWGDLPNNCGALGVRVNDRSQLDDGLAQILNHAGPAMLEVITDGYLI